MLKSLSLILLLASLLGASSLEEACGRLGDVDRLTGPHSPLLSEFGVFRSDGRSEYDLIGFTAISQYGHDQVASEFLDLPVGVHSFQLRHFLSCPQRTGYDESLYIYRQDFDNVMSRFYAEDFTIDLDSWEVEEQDIPRRIATHRRDGDAIVLPIKRGDGAIQKFRIALLISPQETARIVRKLSWSSMRLIGRDIAIYDDSDIHVLTRVNGHRKASQVEALRIIRDHLGDAYSVIVFDVEISQEDNFNITEPSCILPVLLHGGLLDRELIKLGGYGDCSQAGILFDGREFHDDLNDLSLASKAYTASQRLRTALEESSRQVRPALCGSKNNNREVECVRLTEVLSVLDRLETDAVALFEQERNLAGLGSYFLVGLHRIRNLVWSLREDDRLRTSHVSDLSRVRLALANSYDSHDINSLAMKGNLWIDTKKWLSDLIDQVRDTSGDLSVTVSIRSLPVGAIVRIYPVLLSEEVRTFRTNQQAEIFRGLYAYKVELFGYKTIQGDNLDLVNDKRNEFICTLISVEAEGDEGNCVPYSSREP